MVKPEDLKREPTQEERWNKASLHGKYTMIKEEIGGIHHEGLDKLIVAIIDKIEGKRPQEADDTSDDSESEAQNQPTKKKR